MNILFTCGGTAGHINPAVALARMFQERDEGTRVLFVGAKGEMEERLVPKEGFELRCVNIDSFFRELSLFALRHNCRAVKNLVVSRRQARDILDDFRPDLVVGTGGYASYPVVRAAAKRGIPTAVHESNAIPGLTTKALSKLCDVVMVGFEESRRHYAHPEKVVVTGTPVREDFFRYTRKEARAALGFTDDRPLLLSYWGSLGARDMNESMVPFLRREAAGGAPFRHIHGAGRDYARLKEALGETLKGAGGVELREYIYDMPLVMAAADLVICRSGASTVSEIAALAKPAILVPSPNVVADHQTKNAKVLSDVGGAVLLPERECTPDRLYEEAEALLKDPAGREEMSRRLARLSIPDANEKIYRVLKEMAR